MQKRPEKDIPKKTHIARPNRLYMRDEIFPINAAKLMSRINPWSLIQIIPLQTETLLVTDIMC